MPNITLPDGSVRSYDQPITVAGVAASIGAGLAKAALAGKLDGVCDKLVDALMRRPPYALAFSKRTFNRIYAERFNLMFDLGYAYEMMNKEQHGRYVEPRGTTTL